MAACFESTKIFTLKVDRKLSNPIYGASSHKILNLD